MYKDLAKWYELVRQMIENFKLAKRGETIKLILVNHCQVVTREWYNGGERDLVHMNFNTENFKPQAKSRNTVGISLPTGQAWGCSCSWWPTFSLGKTSPRHVEYINGELEDKSTLLVVTESYQEVRPQTSTRQETKARDKAVTVGKRVPQRGKAAVYGGEGHRFGPENMTALTGINSRRKSKNK